MNCTASPARKTPDILPTTSTASRSFTVLRLRQAYLIDRSDDHRNYLTWHSLRNVPLVERSAAASTARNARSLARVSMVAPRDSGTAARSSLWGKGDPIVT